jgi:hypothetical protein
MAKLSEPPYQEGDTIRFRDPDERYEEPGGKEDRWRARGLITSFTIRQSDLYNSGWKIIITHPDFKVAHDLDSAFFVRASLSDTTSRRIRFKSPWTEMEKLDDAGTKHHLNCQRCGVQKEIPADVNDFTQIVSDFLRQHGRCKEQVR